MIIGLYILNWKNQIYKKKIIKKIYKKKLINIKLDLY